MKYELAKRLKDAGFPQSADEEGTLRKGGGYIFPENLSLATPRKKFDEVVAYAPTLSELIEECGDKFHFLAYELTWRAFAKGDRQRGEVRGHYNTPEEAVSELWLALNSK